jgi:hypothetical protein
MKPVSTAPIYATYYPAMAETARAHGYALAVHGSMATDMDLIAMPWIQDASSMEVLVEAFKENHGLREVAPTLGPFGPHRRHTFTLIISGQFYIDLTVLPKDKSQMTTAQLTQDDGGKE